MFRTRSDFENFLGAMPRPDAQAREEAVQHQQQLTKPPGSLGRLEEIAVFLAGWQKPAIRGEYIQVVLFAGNHGVTKQGVSPYPSEVTAQMVANFRHGGAAISALSNVFGLRLSVHPLELERPTGDISVEDAMTEDETLAALNAGAKAVDANADIVVIGEMGIGNTTIAAALCAASLGGTGLDWAGAGTGLDWPASCTRRRSSIARWRAWARGRFRRLNVCNVWAGANFARWWVRSVLRGRIGSRSCSTALSPARRWRPYSRGRRGFSIIVWRVIARPSADMHGCWSVSI